jgi:hypothetical protein
MFTLIRTDVLRVEYRLPIIERFPIIRTPTPNCSKKYATIKMGKECEKYNMMEPAMLNPNPI